MAGADETPDDRAGYIVQTKCYRQYIGSPSLVSEAFFLPCYAVTEFSCYVVKTCPLLLPREKISVFVWGAVAN